MKPFETIGAFLDDVLSIALLLLVVAPVVGVGIIFMFLSDKLKEVFR